MAPPTEVAAQAQPVRQRQQGGIGLAGILRMACFCYFATKFFSPKKAVDPSQLMSNLFQKGEPLDMWLFLSNQQKFNDFGNDHSLVWHESNIPYAVWGSASTRSLSLKYTPSETLKHNGSLYVHVFFVRSGFPPDPYDPEYQYESVFSKTYPIVVYYPKSKSGQKRSLLNSKAFEEEVSIPEVKDDIQAEPKDEGTVEWISYWKPNITINLLDDFNRYSYNAIPPHIAGSLNIDPNTRNYFPIIYFNEFWLLRDKLIPLNDTVTELPLNLELGLIGLNKWQFFLQIEQSFQIHRSYGSMVEGEADELKVEAV